MEVKALVKSEWNEVEGSRPAVQFASHSTRSIGHFLVEEVITRTKGETPVREKLMLPEKLSVWVNLLSYSSFSLLNV